MSNAFEDMVRKRAEAEEAFQRAGSIVREWFNEKFVKYNPSWVFSSWISPQTADDTVIMINFRVNPREIDSFHMSMNVPIDEIFPPGQEDTSDELAELETIKKTKSDDGQ